MFLPLSLLTGITGVFFRALALTMAVALLTSLVLALTFTPALAERFSRSVRGERGIEESEGGRVLRRVSDLYEKSLRFALAHLRIVAIAALAVLVAGVGLYRFVGSDFLPQFDEGGFVFDYLTAPGASLEETDRILKRIEAILESTPEVESYSRRTGAQLGLDITEPNSGDLLVKLKHNRSRSTEEVKSEIRDRVAAEFPEDVIAIELPGIMTDLINDLISTTEPIEIKIFSNDTETLLGKAEEVKSTIDGVKGVTDTNNGVVVSGPALTFNVDPLKAAAFGVTTAEVADTARTAIGGTVATSLLEKGRLVGIRVLLPADARSSIDAIRAIPMKSASTGAIFRLGQVADVEFEEGQTQLHRDNLRQSVVVTAGIEDTDLGTAIAGIKKAIGEKVVLPPGMSISYGGIYEEQQRTFLSLAVSLAAAVVLVFLVLLIEFRSFRAPTAIVAGALLALPGVLAGLVVTGMTLNVVSFMGAIMVVGIVAKNGILMLDTVEDYIATGMSLDEALVNSGRRRLRPVLMTSFAAILGMLPLALAIGEGSELLQPLAIAVIGGLAVALLLSLVVTPAVYRALASDHSLS